MATKRARITDRNPLTATDGVLAGYEQVNKSASQVSEPEDRQVTSEQVNKLESQQSNKTTSKQSSKSASQNELAIRDNIATEEVRKSTSQQVENPGLTSQEPNKPGIQKVNELELLGDRLESEKVGSQQSEKVGSQQSEKVGSQQVSKPIIRKATFQVDAAILEALDRYHLQLQIEMGKRNAPYKEILVEEAIAQWLERADKSPDRAVKSLLKRQEQR